MAQADSGPNRAIASLVILVSAYTFTHQSLPFGAVDAYRYTIGAVIAWLFAALAIFRIRPLGSLERSAIIGWFVIVSLAAAKTLYEFVIINMYADR